MMKEMWVVDNNMFIILVEEKPVINPLSHKQGLGE